MKINTKQCKPVKTSPALVTSDSIIINKNKFIVDETQTVVVTPDQCPSAVTATPGSSSSSSFVVAGARECKYLATIILTPILTSKRLEEKEESAKKNTKTVPAIGDKSVKAAPQNKRLVVKKDELNDICQKLENTFIDEDKKKDDKNTKDTSKPSNENGDEALLGRVYKWIFSYRTNKKHLVLRSARIMENETIKA